MQGESWLSSALSRLEIWWNSLKAWLDAPLFGHGLGGFDAGYAPHRADHQWFLDQTIINVPWHAAGQAHNVILQSLIELGLVGLILAGLFLWSIARREISAALVAAFAMCLIEFPEQNPASAVMIACALGLASRVKPASRS